MPADVSRALLFDLDGTLVDTDPVHFLAFEALLREHDRTISKDDYDATISGHSNEEVCLNLFPSMPVSAHQAFADRKEALFRELSRELRPMAGLVPLLDYAREAGFALAVVTNAPRANLEHMLDVLGIGAYVDTVVVGEELPRAKPDPLPYLTALDVLGVAAKHALAFEDSVPGIRAARGAGLATIGIASTLSVEALQAQGVELAASNYDDARLWQRVRQLAA